MKIARKTLVLASGLLLTASAFGYFFWYKPVSHNSVKSKAVVVAGKKHSGNTETMLRLSKKALSAKDYVAANHFNTRRCFLIDMRIPSGENRFFIYNLEKDSVETAGLVTHGSGGNDNSGTPVFSNTPNSNCTSLGKYRIGKPYQGRFGLAYKLYGLENTNSNAFKRFVVLHAHGCVPNEEVAPLSICESWGCPTVSPAFLTRLRSYLDEPAKPVMLWIYY
ncbi:MAG: murein L,D-transpeptidase catalytic domain-containing protein [Ferruginibacter sp.]